MGGCPSGRLVSLQEAQARSQSQREAAEKLGADKVSPNKHERALESGDERKGPRSRKKSGGGSSWRTFFAIGKNSSQQKKSRSGGLRETAAHQRVMETVTLRSAKSEESLCSHTSGAGFHQTSRLRRPRSTSDGLTSRLPHCRSAESLAQSSPSPPGVPSPPPTSARPQSAWIEEDLDLSPPLPEMDGLGFDPLSFRLSFSDHEEVKSPTIVRADVTSPRHSLPRRLSLSPTGGCSPSPSHSPPERLVKDGEKQGPRSLSPPPPQMLNLLLQSCQLRLNETCQKEIKGKLTGAPNQEDPPKGVTLSPQQSAHPPPMTVVRQLPPPPPPKDPARLMALKLAESAQRALQSTISTGTVPAKSSQRSAPPHPSASVFRRSLSMECSESSAPKEGPLYSELRPSLISPNDRSTTQHRPPRPQMHSTMAPNSTAADFRKMAPSVAPPSRAPRLHTRSGSLPAPPSLFPPRIRPPPYRYPEEGSRMPPHRSAPPWPEPEGLYYEILGDSPHMAPLNASYGLIQTPWPYMASPPSHPHSVPPPGWYGQPPPPEPEHLSYQRWDRTPHAHLRPYMVGGSVPYSYIGTSEGRSQPNSRPHQQGRREEPIYVNLPQKSDLGGNFQSNRDPADPKPDLPHKHRPGQPPGITRHESFGEPQPTKQQHNPQPLRREGSLSYFRPPPLPHPAMWGTQPKYQEGREPQIITYETPGGGGGQRMGYVPPHCMMSEGGTLYGNLEQRGPPHRSATPAGFMGSPWTVHTEGQTRSYC
ncbi:hypothetical protein GDO81_014626 [Engystomops pustulosus]|nr:hypothetical protein GDO81_014626 [Engystomops pustulosus]